jgi:hypothetical protein
MLQLTENEQFLARFKGRSDMYAQQENGGKRWFPEHQPLTTTTTLARHLAGKITAGIYVVRPDQTTHVLVWDIDTGENARDDAERILDSLEAIGIPRAHAFVVTTGGRSVHVWLFTAGVPAEMAWRVAQGVKADAGIDGNVDAFPAQPKTSTTNPFGNLVRLPLGVHRATGGRSEVLAGDWRTAPDVTYRQLREAAEQVGLKVKVVITDDADRPPPRPVKGLPRFPCIVRMEDEGVEEGRRHNAIFSLAADSRRREMPEEEALDRVLVANSGFVPPMPESNVRRDVADVYAASRPPGIFCPLAFLHEDRASIGKGPLCSKRCVLYDKFANGMAATDDAPEGSAVVGHRQGPRLPAGQPGARWQPQAAPPQRSPRRDRFDPGRRFCVEVFQVEPRRRGGWLVYVRHRSGDEAFGVFDTAPKVGDRVCPEIIRTEPSVYDSDVLRVHLEHGIELTVPTKETRNA